MSNATPLRARHIVLGITGGVAAYKSAELVRLLVKAIAVQVVMTEAATRFVTPATFQALSGRNVFVDLWDDRIANGMAHIDLSREAAAILVAPASADFLSKIAHGKADDLLSTLCLARDCPLLVAPAMNRQMWENAATRRNVAQLAADGVVVLGPAAGDQACGEIGMGRMLEPEELHQALVGFFQPKLLAGKRVLLTAGPTFRKRSIRSAASPIELRQDGLCAGARLGDGRRHLTTGNRSDRFSHPNSASDRCDPGRRHARGSREPSAGCGHLHRRRRGRRLHGRQSQCGQAQEGRCATPHSNSHRLSTFSQGLQPPPTGLSASASPPNRTTSRRTPKKREKRAFP